MNTKKISTIILIALISSTSWAQDFRGEIGLGYMDTDIENQTLLTGEFHFNTVATAGLPLEEAAFLGKSNNLKLSVTSGDIVDAQELELELYVADKFYIAPGYSRADAGFIDTSLFHVALGYTVVDGLLVKTLVTEDGYDLNADVKYVTETASGNYVNFEAAYADAGDEGGDNTYRVAFDYYLDDTFSLGGGISNIGDTSYMIRTNKFFTDNFRAGLSYTSSDILDLIVLDAAIRF